MAPRASGLPASKHPSNPSPFLCLGPTATGTLPLCHPTAWPGLWVPATQFTDRKCPAGVPSEYLFPPQLFAFLGFLTSALWINAAATEVVNILRSLGVVFRLSNTVLGLTLLAWGNSIGGNLELLVALLFPSRTQSWRGHPGCVSAVTF